jgi:hypothetical protein
VRATGGNAAGPRIGAAAEPTRRQPTARAAHGVPAAPALRTGSGADHSMDDDFCLTALGEIDRFVNGLHNEK